MARLVVNPGSPDAWEIPLRPGVNSLGRGPENDVPLSEDSVSDSHCQIHLSDGRAILTDLGSTTGTFVNHSPIQETLLQSGQKIFVGNVELAYYADASATAVVASVPPAIFNDHKFCKIHLGTPAKYYCDKCRGLFCEICVSSSPINGVTHKLCRKCNCDCAPVRIEILDEPEKGFYSEIPGAFAYPLRGAGIFMLLFGTVMMGVINFAAGTGRFNAGLQVAAASLWWRLMLQVIATGYMFCYMQNIIHSTALGEKKMPGLPDITNIWDDLILPCLQLIGVTLISFAPVILFGVCLVAMGTQASGAVQLSLSVLGCVYFPMAFLAVAMLDTVAAANPFQVVPSILKVPGEYLTALCVLGLVFVARAVGDLVLKLIFPKELLTHSTSQLFVMLGLNAIWALISFYLLTVGIRILGLLYVTRKEILGWLNH